MAERKVFTSPYILEKCRKQINMVCPMPNNLNQKQPLSHCGKRLLVPIGCVE